MKFDKIDNWCFVTTAKHKNKLLTELRIYGNADGVTNINDGDTMVTALVVSMQQQDGGLVATTEQNRQYVLGNIKQTYRTTTSNFLKKNWGIKLSD